MRIRIKLTIILSTLLLSITSFATDSMKIIQINNKRVIVEKPKNSELYMGLSIKFRNEEGRLIALGNIIKISKRYVLVKVKKGKVSMDSLAISSKAESSTAPTLTNTNSLKLKKVTKKKKTFNDRTIDLSTSYSMGDLIDKDSKEDERIKDLSISGINLKIGYIFHPNSRITLTPSFLINSYQLDNLKTQRPTSNVKTNSFVDFGFSQRFALNIGTGVGVLRPFLEAGYSYGMYTATYDENFSDEDKEEWLWNYQRAVASTGLQYVFNFGLSLNLKYSYSLLNFDKDMRRTFERDGQRYQEMIDAQGINKYATSEIILGVGYIF